MMSCPSGESGHWERMKPTICTKTVTAIQIVLLSADNPSYPDHCTGLCAKSCLRSGDVCSCVGPVLENRSPNFKKIISLTS